MTLYTIEWCERKVTSTNKTKMDARLRGADGSLIENVSIWGDFPNFAGLMNGGQVEGDLVPAKDPKYGPTLYPPRPQTTSGGAPRSSGGAFKQKQIEEHTARKEMFIKETIGAKERAIQMAGAERDAVLLVTTFYQPIWMKDPILEHELDKLIKDKVVFFRDWLLSDDFTNTIPF